MSAAMPWRRIGLSSTKAMRIGLGALVIGLLRFFRARSRGLVSVVAWAVAVDDGSGHRQFDFGAGIEFAPDIEMAADLFGAFAHSGQTPVANAFAVIENMGIDTGTVIADANAQKFFTVSNFGFDIFGLGVSISVAERLAQDAVNFVAHDGFERPGSAFDQDVESGRISGRIRGRKFPAQSGEALAEIVIDQDGGADVGIGLAAFNDSLLGALERTVQPLAGLCGIGGKKIARALKMQHQALKTLEQSIVKFAGDAGALGEAFFVLQIEASGDLLQVAVIRGPGDGPGGGGA